jgi:hypothetical protein
MTHTTACSARHARQPFISARLLPMVARRPPQRLPLATHVPQHACPSRIWSPLEPDPCGSALRPPMGTPTSSAGGLRRKAVLVRPSCYSRCLSTVFGRCALISGRHRHTALENGKFGGDINHTRPENQPIAPGGVPCVNQRSRRVFQRPQPCRGRR